MFANGLQPWHILVLVVVLIALFGAKRLPGAARGIGQSMRIFKAEAKEMRGGGDGESSEDKAEENKAEEPVKQQLQQAKETEPKQAASDGQHAEKQAESKQTESQT